MRELAPQVLGSVARRFRDFSSAEDAVQEAMLAAYSNGRGRGSRKPTRLVDPGRIPPHDRSRAQRNFPSTTGDRVAVDARTSRTLSMTMDPDMDPDDTLILLFMCCHPAPYFMPPRSL